MGEAEAGLWDDEFLRKYLVALNAPLPPGLYALGGTEPQHDDHVTAWQIKVPLAGLVLRFNPLSTPDVEAV